MISEWSNIYIDQPDNFGVHDTLNGNSYIFFSFEKKITGELISSLQAFETSLLMIGAGRWPNSIIFIYFAYKGIIAYLIHRELYGGGLDTLVLLRASISGIMLLLILLFVQFIKIPDLKSHRTILRGVFIGWTSVFVILLIVNLSSIYFFIITGVVSFFSLITLFSLEDQIKEEKNNLTEKEIYLLQQLAKKK